MSEQLDFSFILAGSYICLFLFTLEIVMLVSYFRGEDQKRDSKIIKAAVSFNFVMDIVGTFACCASVYTFVLRSLGSGKNHQQLQWPYPILMFTNSFTAIVVQCFMTHRYWSLSHNRIITPIIMFFAWASFVGTMCMAVAGIVWSDLKYRNRHIYFVVLSGGAATVTDWLILVCLVKMLWKQKIRSNQTRSMVKRLTCLAIQVGTAPSIAVMCAVIFILVFPQTRVSAPFGMSFGRVYTCTMLFTLTRRDHVRGNEESWVTSGSLELSTAGTPGVPSLQAPSPAMVSLSGSASASNRIRARLGVDSTSTRRADVEGGFGEKEADFRLGSVSGYATGTGSGSQRTPSSSSLSFNSSPCSSSSFWSTRKTSCPSNPISKISEAASTFGP